MFRFARFAALTLALTTTGITATASAEEPPTGPELLKRIDDALNSMTTGRFESKLLVYQKDGKAREYAFTTFQKAPDKRLVKFTAPGDVRGMGVLIESKETMYVYLPGFNKIRRMGTHIRNQTFMGSEFGFDDTATLNFSDTWTAKYVGQDDKSYQLELSAKPGIETDTPKVMMWVDKTRYFMTKAEYFDASGQKQKTQLREDYKADSPRHWQPMKITILNNRTDRKSEIVFTETEIDKPLPDDLFSQRSLLRGN